MGAGLRTGTKVTGFPSGRLRLPRTGLYHRTLKLARQPLTLPRSYIRQECGATRRPESPDVKAPEGREDTVPPWSGQPRGRATRRAVAKANGSSDEKVIPHEADLRGNWSCQGFSTYPMVRAGAEELRCTHRGSRRIEDGNSGQYSSESPEGLGIIQDDP